MFFLYYNNSEHYCVKVTKNHQDFYKNAFKYNTKKEYCIKASLHLLLQRFCKMGESKAQGNVELLVFDIINLRTRVLGKIIMYFPLKNNF